MEETYRLSVDECEKLIGHCWDHGINAFNLSFSDPRLENYEETAKLCPHCGLRKMRKVVTTYREERPSPHG